MKSFRIWLLLLLAVLLPVRGALAAGMLCPVAGSGGQVRVASMQAVHHHEASLQSAEPAGMHADGHIHHHTSVPDTSAQHDASTHHHADGTAHDHGGNADKCNLCSAFCSVTGLVSAAMTVAAPQPVSAVFPHLFAPPSSFVMDGQERPPRTI